MLKNRTIMAMLAFFLLGAAVLFFQNIRKFMSPTSMQGESSESLLNPNAINGMELVYKGVPYTLNLKQQMQTIDFVNKSNPFAGRFLPEASLGFDKITIYLFDDKEGLSLTPIVYLKNNLVFQIPKLKEGAFIEESDGKLKAFISTLYDH